MVRKHGCKAVDIDALLEGKATAFVHVHSAAMLHLVASGIDIKPDTCPETLLFDVHRLATLSNRIRYIGTSVTLIVTFMHALTATKRPEANGECDKVMAAVSQSATKDIDTALDLVMKAAEETTLLPGDSKSALISALPSRSCVAPSDAVNGLL